MLGIKVSRRGDGNVQSVELNLGNQLSDSRLAVGRFGGKLGA
jgi:hypothetical protein